MSESPSDTDRTSREAHTQHEATGHTHKKTKTKRIQVTSPDRSSVFLPFALSCVSLRYFFLSGKNRVPPEVSASRETEEGDRAWEAAVRVGLQADFSETSSRNGGIGSRRLFQLRHSSSKRSPKTGLGTHLISACSTRLHQRHAYIRN